MRHAYVLAIVGLGCGDRAPAAAVCPPAVITVATADASVAPGDAGVEAAVIASAPCTPDETLQPAARTHDQLTLTRAAFKDLPGWADDHLSQAVPVLRSCERSPLLTTSPSVTMAWRPGPPGARHAPRRSSSR
jgi:hypothetical protein